VAQAATDQPPRDQRSVHCERARSAEDKVLSELGSSAHVIDRIWHLREDQMSAAARPLALDFGFREAVATNDEATVRSALGNIAARIAVPHAFVVTYDGRVIGQGQNPSDLSADLIHPLRPDHCAVNSIPVLGGRYADLRHQVVELAGEAGAVHLLDGRHLSRQAVGVHQVLGLVVGDDTDALAATEAVMPLGEAVGDLGSLGMALETERMASSILIRVAETSNQLMSRWPDVREVRDLQDRYLELAATSEQAALPAALCKPLAVLQPAARPRLLHRRYAQFFYAHPPYCFPPLYKAMHPVPAPAIPRWCSVEKARAALERAAELVGVAEEQEPGGVTAAAPVEFAALVLRRVVPAA